MLLVLTSNLSAQLLDRVRRHLAHSAVVLPATNDAAALDIARRLPVSIVVADMTSLTAERLSGHLQMAQTMPDAIFCCVASAAVKDQIKTEELFEPDFWIDPDAPLTEVADQLTAAVDKARLKARPATSPAPTEAPPAESSPGIGAEHEVFRRLMAALAGQSDPDRLLQAFVESAAELVRCTSYCLLTREAHTRELTVKAAQGLHPQVIEHARLLPDDALLTWYDQNCRVLTDDELERWHDPVQAAEIARELRVFRGQVVIPLVVAGDLEGLMLLGEKALGDPYTRRELETLFTLSGYVGVQLQSVRQQQRHYHVAAHMDRSLAAMDCGVITLAADERIVLCNPAAARMLQLRREDVEGADLRCLPSPLGDRLYAALTSSAAAVTGETLQLPGLGIWLSVSTFALQGDDGQALGSFMVLQDISQSLDEQARTTEQASLKLLTDLVGRITHGVRTPLTAIKTYGQLMDEGQPATELADFWRQTVATELERLDHLLEQLVELVQQPEPDLQLVDLEALLTDTIRKASDTDTQLRPAPVLRFATPLPRIVVDPTRTRDALAYLLRYLEAMDDSPVTVFVDQQHDESGSNARIRMRRAADASELTPEHIFDPLQALRRPQADLGPVISRRIVDLQGGTIQARTQDGDIEVTIQFPVAVADALDRLEEQHDGQT